MQIVPIVEIFFSENRIGQFVQIGKNKKTYHNNPKYWDM